MLGYWSSSGRAQPPPGIMSWRHLPSHPAAESKSSVPQRGCCQTLTTCLPWKGMARVRFLPFPGTPSPWGVPCHSTTAKALLPAAAGICSCPHLCSASPAVSRYLGTLGDPHGLLSRSRALQWRPQPVAILRTWGTLPALMAQLPWLTSPCTKTLH